MNAIRVPILLYHSVSDSPSNEIARWNVSKRTFLDHMDAIADLGCITLTVSQYLNVLELKEPMPDKLVLVTFDDGFAEVASFAAPALLERSISSTVFITTSPVVEARYETVHLPKAPMMDAAAVADLEYFGVEVGSHSHTHVQLDIIEARLARDELVRSKMILEDLLGHRIRSVAYPHGYSNANVRRIAKEVGYESACGVRNAFSSLLDDEFSISRLTVENTTSQSTINAWLDQRGAALGGARNRYRTHLWRLYRRARFNAIPRVRPSYLKWWPLP